MTKEEEEKWDEENEGKPYPDGRTVLASRRLRRKKLMSQKATSVADAAFVVGLLQQQGHLRSPSSVEEFLVARRAERVAIASNRRKRRIQALADFAERREKRYRDMQRKAQEGTKWGLDRFAANRISAEHGAAVIHPFLGKAKIIMPGSEGAAPQNRHLNKEAATTMALNLAPLTPAPNPERVIILWSDLRDATYAAKWSEVVSHGELERMSLAKRSNARGEVFFTHRNVHVFGGVKMGDDGWMRGEAALPAWTISKEQSREVEGKARAAALQPVGDLGEREVVDHDIDAGEGGPGSLDREGVVIENPSQTSQAVGWIRRKLGMAA